jgi:hypothetical protein
VKDRASHHALLSGGGALYSPDYRREQLGKQNIKQLICKRAIILDER